MNEREHVEPLGAATRALIGADVSAAHDASKFASRLWREIDRLNAFFGWMDSQGVPRSSLTREWYAAVAPLLAELQSTPKRRSNREENWTWLLADALYLERIGTKRGPGLIDRLKTDRGWRPAHSSLAVRLSEARSKSTIGRAMRSLESAFGPTARRAFEDALIAARVHSEHRSPL
jgi:hypothetical protein